MKRSDAVALNLIKYSTGKKCSKGHLSERYTKTGQCIQCLNLWKESNKTKVSKYEASYRGSESGKENSRKRSMKYYNKNKIKISKDIKCESVKESKKRYKQRNKHKSAAYEAHRRALKLRATPNWANVDEIMSMYETSSRQGMHVDHIVPLKSDLVCGLHCPDNLQIITPVENCRKSNKFWPDMPGTNAQNRKTVYTVN